MHLASTLRAALNSTIERGNELPPGPDRDELRAESARLDEELDRLLRVERIADYARLTSGAADCRATEPGTLGYGRCVRPTQHGDEHRNANGTPFTPDSERTPA